MTGGGKRRAVIVDECLRPPLVLGFKLHLCAVCELHNRKSGVRTQPDRTVDDRSIINSSDLITATSVWPKAEAMVACRGDRFLGLHLSPPATKLGGGK
jgi:hypothetical protein